MKSKKLTANSIAGKNLIKRKRQYILLIFGIILSMVFSSSVLFFLSCMQTSMQEIQKNTVGAQDGCYVDATEELMQNAVKDGVVADYSFAYVIGGVYSETGSRDNPVSVARLDNKTKEISYLSFKEGSYPQYENEIALEKTAYFMLCPDAKIGDTITVNMLIQNGMNFIDTPVQKSYKLVGIAENKKSNLSASNECLNLIPSAFVSDGSAVEAGGKELLISYITENNNNDNGSGFNNFFTYIVDDKTALEYDNYVMAFFSERSGDESDSLKTDIVFAVILAVVLLVASCMGIVNAFNSNLKDRKKQIGMFRTVGATKRQIISIFGREAFIISLICTPISIVISYFLVYGIAKLLGDSFIFIPDWRVLAGCAVFGILCVMLAAFIPLSAAAKISPVQSVRNIEYARRMIKKKIVSKKAYKPSTLIAKRDMFFGRKTNTAVIVILVLTIFVSCYGFSSYETEKQYASYFMAYDYSLKTSPGNYLSVGNLTTYETGFTDNDIQKILTVPYVENAVGAQDCNAFMLVDEFSPYQKTLYAHDIAQYYDSEKSEYVYPETNEMDAFIEKDYEKQYGAAMQKFGYTENLFPLGLEAFYPQVITKLNNYVIDGRVDINKLNSGEEVILIAPTEFAFYFTEKNESGYGTGVDTDEKINKNKDYFMKASRDIKAGDKIKLSVIWGEEIDENYELTGDFIRKDKEVTIGAILSDTPETFTAEKNFGSNDTLRAITTISGMKQFSDKEKYNNINITLKTDCDDEIEAEMIEFLSSVTANVSDSYIESDFANAQTNRKYYNTILFSMISVIVLFLSISASIINNSMSSRIRESKRKIGTMRAVGASVDVVVQSYMRQLLVIFGISYGAGFGLFGLTVLILYIVEKIKYPTSAFSLQIHIWQTLIACVFLFAVCSLNLWFKIRKEMKNSIIDNIREL